MHSVGAEDKKPEMALPVDRLPLQPIGKGFTLLDGVRVVDLSGSIAGPYAAMLLSDFGAEVIKIERPEGDDARQWGPPFYQGQALWFAAVNRNKKSVIIDGSKAEDRDRLLKLIETADVVISNHTPSVQRKLGLDYETFSALNPGLIFVSITGFGLDGERANLTCYDLIAEGYSGIMDITGTADAPPQKVGAPAADMLAGQDAAMSAMAALFSRKASGKGAKIDVSLVQSMTRFLTCRISSYLGSGDVPVRSGGTDSVIAIYQAFDTADLPITLGIGSNAIWHRFWQAMGDEDYSRQPNFATNAQRAAHREEIVEKIQALLKTKPRSEWLKLFASQRVPAGPINSVEEVSHDAALQERGMFFALQGAGGEIVPQIGLGIQIDGAFAVPRALPPRLGEHTKEVLGALR